MFAPECVDEVERLSELTGFDQEAGAIDFPYSGRFSHVQSTPWGRENEKVVFALRLPIFDCYSLQLSLISWRLVCCWLKCLFEVEDESTRARGRGQFPKFGAVRKKLDADFGGCAAGKKLLRVFDSSMWAAVLLAVSKREEESVDVDQDYFHSGCTGNAERHLQNQPRMFADFHGSSKFLGGAGLRPGPTQDLSFV